MKTYRSGNAKGYFGGPLWLCVMLLLVCSVMPRYALAIRTVGTDPGCGFHTIQSAIEAVLNEERSTNPLQGDPFIAVAEGAYRENLVIDIDAHNVGHFPQNPPGMQDAFIQIEGGWDSTCSRVNGGVTQILGDKNRGNSTLEIRTETNFNNHYISLGRLYLENARNVPSGGGISFHGAGGALHLGGQALGSFISIDSNQAGNGAGLFVRGKSPSLGAGLSVFLHEGTHIQFNNATGSGGGIHVEGHALVFANEDATLISNNTADVGGGIRATSGANVDLASSGDAGTPVVSSNSARLGGGVSVDGNARIRLFSKSATSPVSVSGNTAQERGGGVFVDAASSGSRGVLCGNVFKINANHAPIGAAISLQESGDGSLGGFARLTAYDMQTQLSGQCSSPRLEPLGACPDGEMCNQIDNNVGDSSIIEGSPSLVADLRAERLEMTGNIATALYHGSSIALGNCLIDHNFVNAVLASSGTSGSLNINGCTVAANSLLFSPPAPIFSIGSGGVAVSASSDIFHLAVNGKVVQLGCGGCSPSVSLSDIVATTFASPIVAGANTTLDNVRFVPEIGFVNDGARDFHLRRGSPAVDVSARAVQRPFPIFEIGGPDRFLTTDLDGVPRGIPTTCASSTTVYDAGAYESQVLDPACRLPQTITFTSPAPTSAVVGGPTYSVAAAATSGLPVSFTIDPFVSATVCTLGTDDVVSFVGVGDCVIYADQGGDATFAAAEQVRQVFTVDGAPQTIAFTSTVPGSAIVRVGSYAPVAVASSNLPVELSIDASSVNVCAINNGVVSFVGAGTCVIDANQPGDGTFAAAQQVQQSFVVKSAGGTTSQTIVFTSTVPSTAVVGVGSYAPVAVASSNLPVVLIIDATSVNVCAISNNTVSFIGAGTCVIDANQGGDAIFAPAPQVQQSFTVNPAVGTALQTITFTSNAPSNAVKGGASYTATAVATSGLPVVLTIDTSSDTVCTINNGTVSFIGVGTCTIDANQGGDAIFAPAPQVQQSFAVNPAVGTALQTITFTSNAPSNAFVGGSPYTVTAVASSGLPVALTIDASSDTVCTISNGTVSFIGVGTCVIDANQGGDEIFAPAAQVQQSFGVARSPSPNITCVLPTQVNLAGTVSPDGTTDVVGIDLTKLFTPPAGNTLSYSVAGLPPSIAIDQQSGVLIGAFAANDDAGSPYHATLTATAIPLNTVASETVEFIVLSEADHIFRNGFDGPSQPCQ